MESVRKALAMVSGGFRSLLIGERENPAGESAAFTANRQMLLPGITEQYRLQAVEEPAAAPARNVPATVLRDFVPERSRGDHA